MLCSDGSHTFVSFQNVICFCDRVGSEKSYLVSVLFLFSVLRNLTFFFQFSNKCFCYTSNHNSQCHSVYRLALNCHLFNSAISEKKVEQTWPIKLVLSMGTVC